MAYVYLIKSNIDDKITYKIGKTTRTPTHRLKELSTGNAGILEISSYYQTKDASTLEVMLKAYYNKFNINREWFSEELNEYEFTSICKLLNDRIIQLRKKVNPFI